MKISGSASLASPQEQVFDAFHDPAVLARTLPGCESLTELGPGRYAMRITAGVSAVKGTYEGTVELGDPQRPDAFTMKAAGAGAPGTVEATVVVRLSPSADGGTDLTYDADAAVGGPVGGVGQRMLNGVTKKMAGQFFAAVDAEIAGVRPEERAVAAVPAVAAIPAVAAARAPGIDTASGATPTTYAGRVPAARPGLSGDNAGFAAGALFGGLLALAGVAVGAAIARRR